MTHPFNLNRTFRILYPATVFFSLALAWNASGQSPHPIDFHFPRLTDPFERSPASTNVSCSEDRQALSHASSCRIDNRDWKLPNTVDTNDFTTDSHSEPRLAKAKAQQAGTSL